MQRRGNWQRIDWKKPHSAAGRGAAGGVSRRVPGVAGLPPVVVGLLIMGLVLGAGYLGWRRAVTPAAPAGDLPPARGGFLVAPPAGPAAFFAGVDEPGEPGDRAARMARWRQAAEAVVAARGGAGTDLTGAFAWPVTAPISSPFGPRWGRHHNGIDLAADHGEPIRASRAGEVLLAGEVEGYGLTVVIGHDDGTRTLYAHASALLVEAGEWVEQGQPIARVGSTGNSTGPHLHFEIIVGDRPVDPLDYLPPRE
ncbi:M23 family metallopeptidase [Symbiobacterium thermophilum]|uniref:Putative peptidase n=1 Tax=Symbiobacterium thermophilum (strain DSM 24528 / JCM 14929 / IAM 14863 / T) TaxID=292459 RepID=Q67TE0_SYMTH|nr:M23 family metallopeptidase [Symbiobacterium thermophilum]BAD39053.1 putative peptidase [Symbiobacterium thermophilum IAM 14863]